MVSTRTVAALATSLALGACSRVTEPRAASSELQALPRSLSTAESGLVAASNAFSFALWRTVSGAQTNQNVFISPLSASFALGMTLNGAANHTFDQMQAALQLNGLSQEDIDAGYKSLIALLTSLDPSVTMGIANSIWYRRSFPFDQSFMTAAQTYFDAEVQGLDFTDVTGSVGTINDWVNRKTNGKIPKIVDGIDPEDVMFLINAMYFKGSWRSKFDPALTTNDLFTTAPGVTEPVRLMHRHDTISYQETPTYQAVDLPYGNGAFTMTVLLPKPGTDIETLSASLSQADWNSILSRLQTSEIDLALPKFRLPYERVLNDDLKALGMVAPFIPDSADFTRMSPLGKQLDISVVKQNTFLDVDEEGTEAAAVTIVGIQTTALESDRIMRVDHPFLFVIRERLSGTILFMGKVVRIP